MEINFEVKLFSIVSSQDLEKKKKKGFSTFFGKDADYIKQEKVKQIFAENKFRGEGYEAISATTFPPINESLLSCPLSLNFTLSLQ